jgi:hypothetical protein
MSKIASRLAMIFLVFVVLLLGFYPMAITLSWHLRNGRSVFYKGRTIPVPLRWTAKAEPQGTILMKLQWNVFARPTIDAWILFDPSPYQFIGRPDDAVKSWEALFWTGQASTNNVVSGPLSIRSGQSETLCMKSISYGNPHVASADCLILQPYLGAHFSGTEADLDTFLKILSDAK